MIFLRLFCIFASVQSEIHNLHYIYTALSKPISQPGVYQFNAMGILDDRPIDIYNSEDKVKKPLQKWMQEHNGKDYWEKGTQSRRSKEQWFDVNIKILMERMHQNKSDPDVHILQWMHGCQVENTTDGKLKFHNGFDQYGYDGEDFLSFDSKNMMWVAPVLAAESTKTKWDNVPILSQYTKGYLETDCVHWLERFLKYQDEELQTFSPPDVYILSKKSTSPLYHTLVCLATGFYQKNMVLNILKDGVPLAESDGVATSEVRPNGDRKETYQQRKWLEIKASDTSKYSCRIHHRTLLSPIEESWDGKCRSCDSDNTGAIVGGVGVVLLIVFVTVLVVLYVLRKKKIEKEKAAQAAANGLNQPLCPLVVNEVNPETKRSNNYVESGNSAAQAPVNGLRLRLNGVRTGAKRSKESVELGDSGKGSTASDEPKEVTKSLMGNEIHDLHYIYTALSKPISQSGVYQFTAMEILNDRPIDIYNSEDKVRKPLQEWMKEQNEKDYWEKGTQSRRRMEQWFDFSINILKEHMQQNKSAAQAPVNGLRLRLNGVNLEIKGSRDSVKAGGSGKGSISSDGSKEVTKRFINAEGEQNRSHSWKPLK